MRTYTEDEIKLIKEGITNRIPKHKIVRTNFQSKFQEFNENMEKLGINYPRFFTKGNRFILNNPFENLDDPEVQYWLGWLATDGYVSLKGNRVSLTVSIKDIDVVEKFKSFLGSDKIKLKHSTHHGQFEMVGINFRSLDVLYFLYSDEVGFCEDKTFEFYPKFKITKDYIRGVFEGDGYVRWYALGGRSNEFSIVSASEKHANVLNDWFHSNGFNTKIVCKTAGHDNPIYTVELYKKKQIQDLLDLIYKDAHTFMNRKYELACAIRNGSNQESPKVGEPASGIPSQAADSAEGVTT